MARNQSATKGRALDSITFEILRHKLDEIIAEAYYTMGRVSGSPVVYEAGDHQEAICTPNGDAAVFGAGVLHWVQSISSGVRRVAGRFADNPGIFEDDQFVVNDPYVAAVHAPDLQLLAPVFYEGQVIAWAGAASHQPDIGGMAPGSLCIGATEIYQEGFQTAGMKLVESGVVRRDLEETFANMVRLPELALLEIRAKIAANNVMKARLIEMVDRYGPDILHALFGQLIQYSEDRVRSRLRSLPDGTWRSRNWIEGVTDENLFVEVAVTKTDDRIHFDFTGSSPQSQSALNIGIVGAKSSAANPFIAMLCHDIPWNEGLFRPLEFTLPDRSIVNPQRPAPVSANVPTGANMLVLTTCQQALSKMLLASPELRGESCGNSGAGHNTLVLAGEDASGHFFSSLILDGAAGGGGAFPHRDGENSNQNPLIVKTMITNVETVEMLSPVLYLWRTEVVGSGGLGKYRGGMGLAAALIPWGIPAMLTINVGCGVRVRNCLGYAGGLPAARTPVRVVRGADLGSWFESGRMPGSEAELEGVSEPIAAKGQAIVGHRDVVVAYLGSGGGGYGDPLDRDPDLVADDIQTGAVTSDTALAAHGVVLVNGTLNSEATTVQRRRVLTERLTRMSGEVHVHVEPTDYIGVLESVGGESDSAGVRCRCGHTLSNGSSLELGSYDEPISVFEPLRLQSENDAFVLRHLGCPSCGLLLDVAMAIPN